MQGVIKLPVNISLNESSKSSIVLEKAQWLATLENKTGPGEVTIEIKCKPLETDNFHFDEQWEFKVDFYFKINTKDSNKQNLDLVFNAAKSVLTFTLKHDEFALSPVRSCHSVGIVMIIKSISGLRRTKPLDFTDKKSLPFSDMQMTLQNGVVVYLHKAIAHLNSPMLRNVGENSTYDFGYAGEMEEVLRYWYDKRYEIKGSNVEKIYAIAEYFCDDNLILNCKKCLIEDKSLKLDFIIKVIVSQNNDLFVKDILDVICKINGFKAADKLAMQDEQFNLRITTGTHRNIASGEPCLSNRCGMGRFSFHFSIMADADTGVNTSVRNVKLTMHSETFIRPNHTWDCKLNLMNVKSNFEHTFKNDTEVAFSNTNSQVELELTDLKSVQKISGSAEFSFDFDIVHISDNRLLGNNFREDMGGVNDFDFSVGKNKMKLYGNENFLKFRSPLLCECKDLPDVDPYDFYDFLELLYDRGSHVTKENISYTLALAHRFQVNMLLEECEQFLIKRLDDRLEKPDFYEIIVWSCTNDLTNLRMKAVKKFVKIDEFAVYMQTQQYKSLLPSHKLMLSEQILIELKA